MRIETSLGMMDESELEPFNELVENDNEIITATGYRHNGEIVQRSVHVHLKAGLKLFSETEGFN